MPVDPILAASIAQGTATAGTTGLGVLTQNAQNRKSRQFSREMYDKQFQDNLRFWNMQNEYNSPLKQMERLKLAGLNPAMLYGKSASAGQAAQIATPDVKSAQFETPDFSGFGNALTNSINQYFDTKIKKAQANNLNAINANKTLDNALKAIELEIKGHNKPYLKQMAAISADAARASLKKTLTDIEVTVSKDVRAAAVDSQNIEESIQRIAEIQARKAKTQAEKQNIIQTGRILKKEADMFEELGIRKDDGLFIRFIIEALSGTPLDLPRLKENIKGNLNFR